MAESESIDCPCSNIAIMQLFHELKQTYPSVPDQIVSKVIQENYHDKTACETILQKENHVYLQSYPGAIISGNSRESLERGSLCNHCPASRTIQQSGDATHSPQCAMPNNRTQPVETPQKQENAFFPSGGGSIYLHKMSANGKEDGSKSQVRNPNEKERLTPTSSSKPQVVKKLEVHNPKMKKSSPTDEDVKKSNSESSKTGIIKCDTKAEDSSEFVSKEPKEVLLESASETTTSQSETESCTTDRESNFSNLSRTSSSDCDCEEKLEPLKRSHSGNLAPSPKDIEYNEVETVRWKVEDSGRKSDGSSGVLTNQVSSGQMSVHNYQVAVQYSMQPALPLRQGENQRSFTTVNLSLRPPSSEPQPPIEIQSGHNLTYTTSVFDAKKGVQTQLQISISPGGGGTVSACRTYVSSPQMRHSCRSSYCTPHISTGFHCHHLKALLEKQRERKDLLARELWKEKEKLRCMQNDVRLMKASIAQKPSPHVLPKLKAEIEKLRAGCERLTAAVDLYSDPQNNLPLGETDEEFYHNIYTGQRLQREGSWSCQLCTFRNHPLLTVCEECEMPRISLGTRVMDVASQLSNVLSNNNTSFCTGGGTSTSASLITAPLQER